MVGSQPASNRDRHQRDKRFKALSLIAPSTLSNLRHSDSRGTTALLNTMFHTGEAQIGLADPISKCACQISQLSTVATSLQPSA